MKVDEKLILHLEHLSRLELSQPEREAILEDLNNILTMVEKLEELDTAQVEPLVYINEDVNTWREDEVSGQVTAEQALKNAPKKTTEYFVAPKVINI